MSELKIYLAQINTSVGDLSGNAQKILAEFEKAKAANADLAVFCEMTLTGYPAQDLWLKENFLQVANEKLQEIIAATKGSKCAILLGAPHITQNRAKKPITYNSAFLIENGEVEKIVHKKTLPNFGVFDEKRYFEAESFLSYFEFRGQTLALLICEDIWDAKNIFLLKEQVFDALISINASPYSTNKDKQRRQITQNIVQEIRKPLIYLNQVGGQDSLVFDGSSFVLNEKGEEVLVLKEFATDAAILNLDKGEITKHAPIAKSSETQSNQEARRNYLACVLGLRDYMAKNNFEKIILGMSGGIDSALVAAIAVDALQEKNVKLYALPSRFNSDSSMNDAKICAKNLNVEMEIISIEPAFSAMLTTLYDYCGAMATTKEAALARQNLQARIRGNILMSISNATNALVLSTGNKSELAAGFATLYGDMCGAFNPVKDLYKTQIYELAKWRNQNIDSLFFCKKIDIIPAAIIIKDPTAELCENQKDSDSLPPYEILDKILFALIEEKKSLETIIKQGFDADLVKKVAKLFYSSEYKRRQSVIGPKISDMSFDKDRRYPITNKFWQ